MNLDTRLTLVEIRAMLGLERHPTCGFVTETYRSPLRISRDMQEALAAAYLKLREEIHSFIR